MNKRQQKKYAKKHYLTFGKRRIAHCKSCNQILDNEGDYYNLKGFCDPFCFRKGRDKGVTEKMFFKKKVESTTIHLASNVYEAWQFTRENLDRADSWVRIHSNNVHLVSQYGGERIWIELSGNRENKILPGDWLVLQEGVGFSSISDAEKKTYWKEVTVE